MRICIVTCRAWPAPSLSDGLYVEALRALDCTVDARPWNDTPAVAFAGYDGVVLRATWDAHEDMEGFARWSRDLEATGVPVFNPLPLVRANYDKASYLDLEKHRIATPRTVLVDRDMSARIAFDALGGNRAVAKPRWGGSGVGVELVMAETVEDAVGRLRERHRRPYMLQEFRPEIADGELSFVFIAGAFAHAVLKRPAAGEFRVNSQYAPPPPEAIVPSRRLLEDALAVLGTARQWTLYARIDGVVRDGCLICTEIELADPSLYMQAHPPTAHLLARATIDAARLARG